MSWSGAARQPHQVFVVDSRQMHPPPSYPPRMDPAPVPCWTFPPARKRRRSWFGCCSSGSGLVTMLVMLLVLIFAALGLGAYQIHNLQHQLNELKDDVKTQHIIAPQGQIGFREDIHEEPKSVIRIAAHLTVSTRRPVNHNILQWESRQGRAFTKGALYRDGGLQVNRTGLYFVYSQVELLDNACFQGSFIHTVSVQRSESKLKNSIILMEGHKEGSCRQGDKRTLQQVWTSNSYLGAVLELKQQDWVYVSVSQPDLINPNDPNGIFFGLYEID